MKNFAAFLIGALVAVMGAEVFLAHSPFIDNPPGQFRRSATRVFEHVPGFKGRDRLGNGIRINALGFRDKEFSAEKPQGTVRVLVLGDSVVFGDGVAADETFAKQLEKILDGKGQRVEVINAGVRGYNTVQELYLLEETGFSVSPDMVILVYTTNDAEPLAKQAGLIDSRMAWLIDVKDFIKQHSYLYAFLRKNLEVLRKSAAPEKFMKTYNDYFDPTSEGWLASVDALGRMKRLTDARGIQLVLAVYPRLEWTAAGYPETSARIHRQILELGRSLKVQTFDLLPPLIAAAPDVSRIKLSASDTFHPNPAGHRLVAKILAREVSVPKKAAA